MMTDYEIVTLFNELLNTSFARLNDFMVGLFALLVTAYFAGRQLPPRMAALLLGLYTVFSVATITAALASAHRFALAGDLVREASTRPGSTLPQLFSMLPSPTFVTPVMGVLLVGAYLGGLAFFFQARRGPPK